MHAHAQTHIYAVSLHFIFTIYNSSTSFLLLLFFALAPFSNTAYKNSIQNQADFEFRAFIVSSGSINFIDESYDRHTIEHDRMEDLAEVSRFHDLHLSSVLSCQSTSLDLLLYVLSNSSFKHVRSSYRHFHQWLHAGSIAHSHSSIVLLLPLPLFLRVRVFSFTNQQSIRFRWWAVINH